MTVSEIEVKVGWKGARDSKSGGREEKKRKKQLTGSEGKHFSLYSICWCLLPGPCRGRCFTSKWKEQPKKSSLPQSFRKLTQVDAVTKLQLMANPLTQIYSGGCVLVSLFASFFHPKKRIKKQRKKMPARAKEQIKHLYFIYLSAFHRSTLSLSLSLCFCHIWLCAREVRKSARRRSKRGRRKSITLILFELAKRTLSLVESNFRAK